jgi:hypothetical protein
LRTRKRRVGVLSLLVVGLVAGVLSTTVGGKGSASATAAGKPYDLVWITDSSGWGAASFYARQVEQSLKVNVRVHDEWVGGLYATTILKRLRNPSDPWVRLIRDAEVVVVYGAPVGLAIAKGGDCVHSIEPPLNVGPQAWPKFIAGMKAIYKQIFAIRNGEPVILRTTTQYVPFIHQAPSSMMSWEQAGIMKQCTKNWEWFSWAISKAAAAYHVGVADVYTAFNGKTHLEDPVAKGYIQSDGWHTNDKGRAVIAKTLAALGYKPVKPPK